MEGVGGLLVPLAEDFTVRDLAVALGLGVLIAARPGLGTINHTLLTLEAARAAGLDVRAVVLTPWPETARRSWSAPTARRSRGWAGSRWWVWVTCQASQADLARAGERFRGDSGARPRVSSQSKRRVSDVVERRLVVVFPPGSPGVVLPEKGGPMNATMDVLTTALLVALLIIDRLTR